MARGRAFLFGKILLKMKIEKYRHIIILRTLIKAKEPVTANTLAKLTNSSLRTIKSDIAHLNALCDEEGIARIRSYKAKGYRIDVKDEAKYKEFSDSIDVLSSMYYRRSVFCCHPGYVDAELLTLTTLSLERVKDAQMMMSEKVMKWIKENNVELITYRELPR